MKTPILALLAFLVAALPAAADPALLARLAEPNTHAVMRHALAPGTGDPENFDITRCETQRNLDANGRRQAERAGQMLRDAGILIDLVWSSRYCRCVETAELMALGEVTVQTALNSFSGASYNGPTRTRQARELLMGLEPGQTALLVTHNVNAEALTGTRPISGEIQVVQVSETGKITLLGRVKVPVF